jgi:hypothetical protein
VIFGDIVRIFRTEIYRIDENDLRVGFWQQNIAEL